MSNISTSILGGLNTLTEFTGGLVSGLTDFANTLTPALTAGVGIANLFGADIGIGGGGGGGTPPINPNPGGGVATPPAPPRQPGVIPGSRVLIPPQSAMPGGAMPAQHSRGGAMSNVSTSPAFFAGPAMRAGAAGALGALGADALFGGGGPSVPLTASGRMPNRFNTLNERGNVVTYLRAPQPRYRITMRGPRRCKGGR